MPTQQVENKRKIKLEEADFLSMICEGIGEAKSILQKGNFALAQGALTSIFNDLGGFVYRSQYLNQERKDRLIALHEFIYESRTRLVNQVEVVGQDLETVVKTSNMYQRLDFIKEVLREYINKWYKS